MNWVEQRWDKMYEDDDRVLDTLTVWPPLTIERDAATNTNSNHPWSIHWSSWTLYTTSRTSPYHISIPRPCNPCCPAINNTNTLHVNMSTRVWSLGTLARSVQCTSVPCTNMKLKCHWYHWYNCLFNFHWYNFLFHSSVLSLSFTILLMLSNNCLCFSAFLPD